MKKNELKILIIQLLLTFNLPSFGQESLVRSNVTFFAGLRSFYWEEYNDMGNSIIEEEGYQFCPGVSGEIFFSEKIPFYLLAKGNVYFGTVDYFGFLQDQYGNVEDYESESGYWGTNISLNFGFLIKTAENLAFSPELGFTYEYWSRDVDNGGNYGYDEYYDLFNLNFSISSKLLISNNSKMNIRLGAFYPVYISETIDLASRGQGGPEDIELEPGASLGIMGEINFTVYKFYIETYFQLSQFDKSNTDQGYHQPESYKEVIGINLGYSL